MNTMTRKQAWLHIAAKFRDWKKDQPPHGICLEITHLNYRDIISSECDSRMHAKLLSFQRSKAAVEMGVDANGSYFFPSPHCDLFDPWIHNRKRAEVCEYLAAEAGKETKP